MTKQHISAARLAAAASVAALAFAAQADYINVAGASLVRFEHVSGVAAPGEILTVDLVLDASEYTGLFDAWSFFEGNIDITSTDIDLTPSIVYAAHDQLDATAPSDVDGDGIEEFIMVEGAPWTHGRRPGVFPNAGPTSGGMQHHASYGYAQTIETDTGVRVTGNGGYVIADGSNRGRLSSYQQPAGTPTFNALMHRGRELHAFRMQLQMPHAEADIILTADIIALSTYHYASVDGRDRLQVDFLQNFTVQPLTLNVSHNNATNAPAPAAAIPLLLALAAHRRRR